VDNSETIMATSALCAWGGFAMQVISAGVLHLWPKHRWIGWFLLGAGRLVFVVAFARWYWDRHPGTESLWIAVAGAGLPPLAIFAWFERPFQFGAFWSGYFFQSPIARRKGWPHNAALAIRVRHIRTHMWFNKFEKEDTIRLCIVLDNTTFEDVFIDSVFGSLCYDQLESEESPPLAFVSTVLPITITPLCSIDIAMEQRVPSEAAERLRDTFGQHKPVEERKAVSFRFDQIHIRIRSSKETTRAILWHGVLCRIISDAPVIEGKTVSISNGSNVEWNASKVVR
jgi:hypothetical protein